MVVKKKADMQKSLDPAAQAMLQVAEKQNIKTVWDRYQAQASRTPHLFLR